MKLNFLKNACKLKIGIIQQFSSFLSCRYDIKSGMEEFSMRIIIIRAIEIAIQWIYAAWKFWIKQIFTELWMRKHNDGLLYTTYC